MISPYRDLKVWQDALELAEECYLYRAIQNS